MTVAYTSPSALKTRMGISDSNHDAEFTAVATAVNDFVEDWLGFPAGSSGTASRTFDGDGSDELYIRGGLQAITTLEVAATVGGSYSTLAATEYVLRPHTYERPTGWPGWRIELTDNATTSGVFTLGHDTVRITPTYWDFGTAVPTMLSRIADILGVRVFQARQSGATYTVGGNEFAQAIDRFLPEPEYRAYLDHMASVLGGRHKAY